MCYDISYQITLDTIEEYFGNIIFDDPQMEFDFDITMHVIAQAYKKALIVINDGTNYRGKLSEWGLISKGMKTPDIIKKRRNSMCNAQSERVVQDKISAWHSIRHQRCLIPVTGIFEHREIKGWKNKVPYYVTLKDRPMFCIPGLYNYSPVPHPETGELILTHTLITRAANSVMKQIHNGGDNAYRMPLFLPKDLESEWLDPNLTDEQIQEILNYEMPSEELDYHPVFQSVQPSRIQRAAEKQRPTTGLTYHRWVMMMVNFKKHYSDMSERLYLKAKVSLAEGVQTVEVFETDIDGILQFYHCVVNANEHLNIMIDENAEWSEVNGKVSHLSQRIGEMIESKAA